MADAKEAARERVTQARDELVALSHRIHANPELGFEEEQACAWLCELLEGPGSRSSGVGDLPTAFAARAGSGPLHVVVCAEYDALPAVGHACGHNVIAAMAAGAGMALARVADDAGLRVTVLGTPAEEGGGGKILLLQRGAFDGAHAAMMVHPSPYEQPEMPIIAVNHLKVAYTGKEAHASAYPFLGVNAADALVVAQTAIGLLRQHLRPSDRVHGIVTKGGDAANIIPAHTTADWMVRAADLEQLEEVRAKVARCFEAGALATGATLELSEDHDPYSEMRHDHELSALYQRNAEALGRTFIGRSDRGAGSTDMGNVSLALPSIHPTIGIDSLPAVNHQPEFTASCATPRPTRPWSTGRWPWPGRRSTPPPTRRSANASWPVRHGPDVRDRPVAPTSLVSGTAVVPHQRGETMKYMILTYASQQDYDGMAGKPTDRPAWSAEDFAAMGEFMESFNKDLADSGELVETRALAAPVLTRRLQLQHGVPVVTDGPYAETQEVLAGYWIVECESFDRATEIAGRLANCPAPAEVAATAVADVRPLADSRTDLEL